MPEIALDFPPEYVRAVKAHPRLREISAGRATSRAIAFTYFDTDDAALRRDGLTVRIVRNGNRHQQVVACADATMSESPVTGEFPQPELIADVPLQQRVMAVAPVPLVAVLRGDARVTRRPIRTPDGHAGIVEIETGTLAGGAKERPYAVLRVRVDGGPAGTPFDIALDLAPSVPFRLCRGNAAGLTFDMAFNGAPKSVKSGKSPLPVDATVEDSMIHVIQGCLDHLIANEPCILETEDPEGVHQMRVAMRRLRSGLRFYRNMIPAAQHDRIVEDVRWLTNELGPTRDLDVFLDEIAGPVMAAFPDEPAFQSLLDAGRAARDEARAASRTAVRSERYRRFVLEGYRWLESRAWRQQGLTEEAAILFRPVTEFADPALAGRYKKVRKRGRSFAVLDAAERHQLRIDVKKLRYAIDFFGSLYRAKRVREFTERLAKLQDDLGYANDVAVARGLLDRLADHSGDVQSVRISGALILGWHTRAMATLQERVGDDIAGFLSCEKFWHGRDA